jgi:Homeodomain-like domain
MPNSTFVDIPKEEHAEMLAALRRARYGDLLPLHILWLCATGRHPTEVAAVLFCSRSSVYRTVRAYQEGALGWEYDAQGRLVPPVRTTVLLPTLLTVAAGSAQGTSRGVWVVPHTLELCHAGPDPVEQPRPHGLSRDHAPLLTVVRP